MPTADRPGLTELREIASRLWKRVASNQPPQPLTSFVLQRIADAEGKSKEPKTRLFALAMSACADALAEAEAEVELPQEIHELRAAVDAHCEWITDANKHSSRVQAAVDKAVPALESWADKRAKEIALAESDEERARLFVNWEPKSFVEGPRALAATFSRHLEVAFRCQKLLHDMVLPNAHAKISANTAPIKTRLAKILKRAGLSPAEIATITEPFAKPGDERRQARNTVRARQKTGKGDTFSFTAPDVPELVAPLEAAVALRLGADVRLTDSAGPDVPSPKLVTAVDSAKSQRR
jgi:hypothetical protein